MISGFCIIVFVRIEYWGDTKMFSPILELNNFSVCTVRSVFFFVFCFSHLSQINMIWDLVYSCGMFLLYESHCMWLDRLLHYLFGFLKLIGYPLQSHWNNFHRKKVFSQVIQELINSGHSESWYVFAFEIRFWKIHCCHVWQARKEYFDIARDGDIYIAIIKTIWQFWAVKHDLCFFIIGETFY